MEVLNRSRATGLDALRGLRLVLAMAGHDQVSLALEAVNCANCYRDPTVLVALDGYICPLDEWRQVMRWHRPPNREDALAPALELVAGRCRSPIRLGK